MQMSMKDAEFRWKHGHCRDLLPIRDSHCHLKSRYTWSGMWVFRELIHFLKGVVLSSVCSDHKDPYSQRRRRLSTVIVDWSAPCLGGVPSLCGSEQTLRRQMSPTNYAAIRNLTKSEMTCFQHRSVQIMPCSMFWDIHGDSAYCNPSAINWIQMVLWNSCLIMKKREISCFFLSVKWSRSKIISNPKIPSEQFLIVLIVSVRI